MDKMNNIVGLWPTVARAYEIALLGGFTIEIVFDVDYTQGFDDYQLLKDYYNDVTFCKDGDMVVVIYKPEYEQKLRDETLEDISKRVIRAKKQPIPSVFKNNGGEMLLETATERLELSYAKREKIIEIAKRIAQLDNSKLIDAHHVGEAIQYNKPYGNFCFAENKSISFGDGIRISLLDLYNADIEDAIEYLSGLLKKD